MFHFFRKILPELSQPLLDQAPEAKEVKIDIEPAAYTKFLSYRRDYPEIHVRSSLTADLWRKILLYSTVEEILMASYGIPRIVQTSLFEGKEPLMRLFMIKREIPFIEDPLNAKIKKVVNRVSSRSNWYSLSNLISFTPGLVSFGTGIFYMTKFLQYENKLTDLLSNPCISYYYKCEPSDYHFVECPPEVHVQEIKNIAASYCNDHSMYLLLMIATGCVIPCFTKCIFYPLGTYIASHVESILTSREPALKVLDEALQSRLCRLLNLSMNELSRLTIGEVLGRLQTTLTQNEELLQSIASPRFPDEQSYQLHCLFHAPKTQSPIQVEMDEHAEQIMQLN